MASERFRGRESVITIKQRSLGLAVLHIRKSTASYISTSIFELP